MNIFEFMGKTIFEDVPELFFEKMPRDVEKTLDNISDGIDKFLDD